jgi:hypothetical protein
MILGHVAHEVKRVELEATRKKALATDDDMAVDDQDVQAKSTPLDGRLMQVSKFIVDGGQLMAFCRPEVLWPTWFLDYYTRMIRRYSVSTITVLDRDGVNIKSVIDNGFVTILDMADNFFVAVFSCGKVPYKLSTWNDSGLSTEVFRLKIRDCIKRFISQTTLLELPGRSGEVWSKYLLYIHPDSAGI